MNLKKKLANPYLNISVQLSDCAGKHIAYIDWAVREEEASSYHSVLLEEIKKNKYIISKELQRIQGLNFPPLDSSIISQFMDPLAIIINIYTGIQSFNIQTINNAYDIIIKLSKDNQIQIPYEIHSIIAATYSIIHTDELEADRDYIENSKKSISIFQEILDQLSEKDSPRAFAETSNRIGNTYFHLSSFHNPYDNILSAIIAFKNSLKVYNEKEYPIEYANTLLSLGAAYAKIALITEKKGLHTSNYEASIEAYSTASKIFLLNHQLKDYAFCQYNLGNSLIHFAKIINSNSLGQKSIDAYIEALNIFTNNLFPLENAMIQNNLGNAYSSLAGIVTSSNKKEAINLCKKSIASHEKALEIYTLDQFPDDYAMSQNNLGNSFTQLSEFENKPENLKKAIFKYREALKVRTLNQSPIKHSEISFILGMVYQSLANFENEIDNLHYAINAYQDVLKYKTSEQFPSDYAITKSIIGTIYEMLADLENEIYNCRMALKTYTEVMKFITNKSHPDIYKNLVVEIKKLEEFLKDK